MGYVLVECYIIVERQGTQSSTKGHKETSTNDDEQGVDSGVFAHFEKVVMNEKVYNKGESLQRKLQPSYKKNTGEYAQPKALLET